jgi:proteasome lid subunit RPN8/RPN11
MSTPDVELGGTDTADVLRISGDVVAVVMDHARSCLPEECCGLLLSDGQTVRLAWPARNELASTNRYRVDPRDYVAAARHGRKRGLDVVGAYHSHPVSRAWPSATDVAEAAGEEFVYVIVGRVALPPHKRELRAFRYRQGNFVELAVVTETQELMP